MRSRRAALTTADSFRAGPPMAHATRRIPGYERPMARISHANCRVFAGRPGRGIRLRRAAGPGRIPAYRVHRPAVYDAVADDPPAAGQATGAAAANRVLVCDAADQRIRGGARYRRLCAPVFQPE